MLSKRRADSQEVEMTEKSLLAQDAAGRIGGPRKILRCSDCGKTFRAGYGHIGSDVCKATVAIAEQHADGFVKIHRQYQGILEDAKIEIRTIRYGALEKDSSMPYGLRAASRIFVPRWAERVLHRGPPQRKDRVALLRLLKKEVYSVERDCIERYGCHWLMGNRALQIRCGTTAEDGFINIHVRKGLANIPRRLQHGEAKKLRDHEKQRVHPGKRGSESRGGSLFDDSTLD